jgi:TPR repeat protein
MSAAIARTLVLSALALLTRAILAQDMFQHIVTSGYEDMAEIKRKAEAGDARSQYKMANSLASQFHPADALQWYKKAARQGDMESFYQAGRMIFYGATGIPHDQSVASNPAEGILLIFRAATNGYHEASYDIYRAYKEGWVLRKMLSKPMPGSSFI